MTITNTNHLGHLFEELGEEDTASISGGVEVEASSSARIDSDSNNSIIRSLFLTDQFPNSLNFGNTLFAQKTAYNNNGSVSVKVQITK